MFWSISYSFVSLYDVLGDSYGWFDLSFYFSMIHLSACNMGLGEGGSHGCGRLSLLFIGQMVYPDGRVV